MRPEAVLMKRIRVAVAKDGRARLVPNFVGLVVPWALVARAVASGDLDVLRKTHPIHAGLGRGSSDLVGMLKTGRVVCLEVKVPGGAVQPEQPIWLRAVRSWGGFAAVVRSPDEAIAAVARACAGASE